MSKFCTKCGRPLQEGEICSCQAAGTIGNSQVHAQQPMSGHQPGNQPHTGQPAPGQNQEGQQFNGQPYTGHQPGNQPYNGQPMSGHQPGNQPYNGQPVPGQQPGGQPYNGQPMPGQQPGGQPYNGQPMPGHQPGGQPYNGQPMPGQQPGGQPYNGQPYNGQPMADQQFGNKASVFAQGFFTRVMNLVKRPVTAGKELIMEADVKVALMLIVFQGIFSSLFAMAGAAKCSGFIKLLSGAADLGGMAEIIQMPYFRIFIVTVLFSLALACLLAVLMLAGHMIIQVPVSFQQMLSAAGIRSAVLVPAILLSIVVFEISAWAGIVMFLLINVWGFAAMIVAMSSFIEQKKMNVFVLMVSVVILLFIIIAAFAVTKIWTLYLPDLIRTGLKELGNMSGQEILQELFGNVF